MLVLAPTAAVEGLVLVSGAIIAEDQCVLCVILALIQVPSQRVEYVHEHVISSLAINSPLFYRCVMIDPLLKHTRIIPISPSCVHRLSPLKTVYLPTARGSTPFLPSFHLPIETFQFTHHQILEFLIIYD